jgi:hypothetical protein
MLELIFLALSIVLIAAAVFLIRLGLRRAGGDPATYFAVLAAVCLFFSVGLGLKGLGIPSPLDAILVPPPLPK